jgi:hypothetical protein
MSRYTLIMLKQQGRYLESAIDPNRRSRPGLDLFGSRPCGRSVTFLSQKPTSNRIFKGTLLSWPRRRGLSRYLGDTQV